ncbi:sensor histidine kinase [Longimicrobium sp.]|uniref:sensor histidine kinase n=1 Tax=Longimicrobium sp. TaxID=2029185 RepID=UPI002C8610FE|nr:histidine kinase [Longimicrobium sp.]HSU16051.1 histidine kinase [Longimicrobium sp.]
MQPAPTPSRRPPRPGGDIHAGDVTRWPLSGYLAAVAAAVVVSALIATENYWVLIRMKQPEPWITLFAFELPNWFIWLLATPSIFWLARRLPVHGPHRWRNVALHLPLSAAAVFLTLILIAAVKAPFREVPIPGMAAFAESVLVEFQRIFATIMPFYFIILGAGTAVQLARESRIRAVRGARLQTQLERARGDLLRMQLQPHFLFNTLHAVSALMERDVPAARRMITRLSDLLRLSLDNDSRYEVSLEEEVEFLDRYVEIQRIRFGARLRVFYDLAPGTRRLMVPRLLLQPLVENAITHGLSRLERPGTVRVESAVADGRLAIRVLDDGAGLAGGAVAREGVGLGNTRLRLQQLYGDSHRFSISDRPEGGCEVRIELPAGTLERAPSADAWWDRDEWVEGAGAPYSTAA